MKWFKRRGGRGSGTPYAIIPKTACVSLESLFGRVGQEGGA